MSEPKLAICNFIPDVDVLKKTAMSHGFSGVDWTFKPEDLPAGSLDESRLLKKISRLHPLEVRYHCAFKGIDFGDADEVRAGAAMEAYRNVCRMVSRLDGRFMTVHLGLGPRPAGELSWERSVEALAELVEYAERLGVCVCLENLASGWSSRPELFEKLIRKSGAGVTLDIGHARVSPSVETRHYDFDDFVSPHRERIFNAHIYHEERENGHLPPEAVDDVMDRLWLLSCLPCDWWVLELREEAALLSTLRVVREFMDAVRRDKPVGYFGTM
jgi:sugar phosphate isomerase/epimerase